jgi:hypothetical protein
VLLHELYLKSWQVDDLALGGRDVFTTQLLDVAQFDFDIFNAIFHARGDSGMLKVLKNS